MLSALSFLACKVTERKPVPVPPGFDWQGHRGARGLAPENSVPSFLRALEFPAVTTLELDLAVSHDRQLIVSHEPWFSPAICLLPDGDSIRGREAEEKYLLYARTLEEIRAYDCGSKGNPRFPRQEKMKVHKPTLREVVEAVRARHPERAAAIRWNIEIKSQPAWDSVRTPPIEEFARLVVQELEALGLKTHANVQSFDPRALEAVHRLDPSVTLALLVENPSGLAANLARLSFLPPIYSPNYLLVNRALVEACHQRGMRIIPWTVNDVPSMRRLIRLGVDGIITDYPDKIADVSR